jgi:hypothetical protein
METLKALFGEWLPDLPDLDNPGLTEANNVIPSDGGYKPFRPLTSLSDPVPATSSAGTITGTFYPLVAIMPVVTGTDLENGTNEFVIVSGVSGTFRYDLSSPTSALPASAVEMFPNTASFDAFAQFEDLIIATSTRNFTARAATLAPGATFTTLATSGSTPIGAAVAGVVGRFVVLGNLNNGPSNKQPFTLRWSAINEPRNWPIPGTSTAAATQAGEQVMPAELGRITGIFGTDQYGIVMQEGGISRMQYVGGSVVFQFDKIESAVGCSFYNGAIMVGGVVYFASVAGFYSTDGISVVPIGNSKVDKLFIDAYNEAGFSDVEYVAQCGYDRINDVIYWGFADNALFGAAPPRHNRLLMYHRPTKRWSQANQDFSILVTPSSGVRSRLLTATAGASTDIVADLYGFDTSRRLCRFAGTPGTATITTSELETVPGKYSHVSGVKPLIEYSGTAPAVSVSLGTRNDQGESSLAFSGTTTATTDTGFADFRQSARYHRAKVQITGAFKKAMGIELKVTPEGER